MTHYQKDISELSGSLDLTAKFSGLWLPETDISIDSLSLLPRLQGVWQNQTLKVHSDLKLQTTKIEVDNKKTQLSVDGLSIENADLELIGNRVAFAELGLPQTQFVQEGGKFTASRAVLKA